jgi:RIO kinase 1
MTRDEPSVESRLDRFLADGHIAEVLHIIKGGKEGVVFCCRGGPLAGAELVAAKVYHQLERRGFRDDAIYQENRLRGPRVRRERLAMAKKSSYGRKVQFGMWARSEFETLAMLHASGADVPLPIACDDGALLMEYIGDESGPAPPLAKVELAREEAPRLLATIVRNVAMWLGLNRVHGDLSAYNVLYRRGAVTMIDFPQAIDPRFNSNARALLERDLCRYFDRFGVRADPNRIARRLWEAFRHGEAFS